MIRNFKYRIYPTVKQKILIHKHIGCARSIYNSALEAKEYAYKSNRHSHQYKDFSSELKELKKEFPYFKEVNSQTLQAALKDLERAYKNFFEHRSGYPNFKSRNNPKRSFRVPQNVKLKGDRVMLPKFDKAGIKICLHRQPIGTIKSATVTYHSSGQYHITLTCHTERQARPVAPIWHKDDIVGIDMGLKDFYVASNGDRLEAPKYYRKAEGKLRFLQRKHSKYEGKRTKIKLSKQHLKVSNQRKDFTHKASRKLVNENIALAIEDLSVKDMIRNRKLSKSIADAGWGMFRQMLKYKSNDSGVPLLVIGKWEPSSKRCNNCGHKNKDLKLSDRQWQCSNCGQKLDRDLNAAKNIRDIAYRGYLKKEEEDDSNIVKKRLHGTGSQKAEGVAKVGVKAGLRSVDSRSATNIV
jgi:putative transposase